MPFQYALAAEKLYQKKNRQYFVYVVTVMFFHVGAIIFLAYFVQKIKINIQQVIFILIILSIFNYFITDQLGYYLIQADIMKHQVRVYFFHCREHNPLPPYYPSNLLQTMAMFTQKYYFNYFFILFYQDFLLVIEVFYLKIYSLSLMLNA